MFHTHSNDQYGSRTQPSKHVLLKTPSEDNRNGFGSRHSLSSRSNHLDIFPCNSPTNPSYANRSTRIQSYQNWPGHIQASREQLADAGFFYLGERDRCKCFYCNGGLQNWESGDDPWFEHAKYFPTCEFLLQQKGPAYVAAVNESFPNLQRPGEAATNTTQQQQINQSSQSEISYDVCPPISSGINENELIAEALQYGFNEKLMKYVLLKKHNSLHKTYDNLANFIEDLITADQNEHCMETMDIDLSPMSFTTSDTKQVPVLACDGYISQPQLHSNDSESSNNLRRQLENVMDESICRLCLAKERSCVFTNCGHLCCCFDCGKSTDQCPICNAKVTDRIKIYKT